MKRKNLHLLCWALMYLYALSAYFLSLADAVSTMLSLSLTSVQLAQFYLGYSVLLPMYMRIRKWWMAVASLFCSIFAFIVLRYLLEEIIYPQLFEISNYGTNVSLVHYVLDNVYYSFSFIFIAVLVFSVEKNYDMNARNIALEQERKKAELAFLRSQVNPHFLFNTLNFMYSESIVVSEKLSNAVLLLSELMRYTLAADNKDNVRVEEEISYLENYIALQKMRFSGLMFVNFKSNVVCADRLIAPLLFIPLVENAFKHGDATDPDFPIVVEISDGDGHINIQVINKKMIGSKIMSTGIGLQNVRRRLELMYMDKFQFEITEDETFYKVCLQLFI